MSHLESCTCTVWQFTFCVLYLCRGASQVSILAFKMSQSGFVYFGGFFYVQIKPHTRMHISPNVHPTLNPTKTTLSQNLNVKPKFHKKNPTPNPTVPKSTHEMLHLHDKGGACRCGPVAPTNLLHFCLFFYFWNTYLLKKYTHYIHTALEKAAQGLD